MNADEHGLKDQSVTPLRSASEPEALREAVRLLRAGELVVFPTETLYAVGCDGLNPQALRRLRRLRERPAGQGFILAVRDVAMAEALTADLPPAARRLMERFWPGPLTLVLPAASGLPAEVTASDGTIAVRESSHPVVAALVEGTDSPLAVPSANRAGEPPARTAEAAAGALGQGVALVLDGGTCAQSQPSTMVRSVAEQPELLREGALPWPRIQAACSR